MRASGRPCWRENHRENWQKVERKTANPPRKHGARVREGVQYGQRCRDSARLNDCATPNFTDPGAIVCPPTQIPNHKMIRCVVVHEITLLRQGLRRLLEDEPDLEIVAEAENAAHALRHILDHRPDVVITDAAVFGGALVEAERMIVRESPETRVVFLLGDDLDERRPGALNRENCAVRETSAGEFVAMVRGPAHKATAGAVSEFHGEDLASRKRVLTSR